MVFPRSLTFSAAIMTAVLIKLREKSKCAHRVRRGELNCRPCLVILVPLLVVGFDVHCKYYSIVSSMEVLNFKLMADDCN